MKIQSLEEGVVLGRHLAVLFEALAAALGVSLAGAAERLAADALADQVSAKRYELAEGPVVVTARVEAYEPGTVWLTFEASSAEIEAVRRIIEAYRLAYGPGAAYRSDDESRALFDQALR